MTFPDRPYKTFQHNCRKKYYCRSLATQRKLKTYLCYVLYNRLVRQDIYIANALSFSLFNVCRVLLVKNATINCETISLIINLLQFLISFCQRVRPLYRGIVVCSPYKYLTHISVYLYKQDTDINKYQIKQLLQIKKYLTY